MARKNTSTPTVTHTTLSLGESRTRLVVCLNSDSNNDDICVRAIRKIDRLREREANLSSRLERTRAQIEELERSLAEFYECRGEHE